MNNICPQCGNPLKLVPAGVSKASGKPYNAFWSCSDPTRSCKYTAKVQTQGVPLQSMSNLQSKTNGEKDREKSIGMVRHGIVLKAIEAGMELNPTTHNWVSRWVDYVMTGKLLTTPNEQAILDMGTEISPDRIPF